MLQRKALVLMPLAFVLIVGCEGPTGKRVRPERLVPHQNASDGHVAAEQQRSGKSDPDLVHESRLKRMEFKDYPIDATHGDVIVWGMWTPESDDPKKALVFPEQVKIVCERSEKTCQEMTVPLGLIGGEVDIMDIEDKSWHIDSWDSHGLRASYGPFRLSIALSEKCHSHVLAMSFDSGAVSTSDIPTHEKGCEAFPETDSYRLVRGNYFVDTSPANDHKPIIASSPKS